MLCTSGLLAQFFRKSQAIIPRSTTFTTKMAASACAVGGGATAKLKSIPDVDIDGEGKFKYILLKLHDSKEAEEHSKYIVRGYAWAGYHADIYEKVDSILSKAGLDCECVGGGRILHEPAKKSILVFGYSTGYGKADHSIATELLKQHYTDYEKISWSNDGY